MRVTDREERPMMLERETDRRDHPMPDGKSDNRPTSEADESLILVRFALF